MNCPQCGTENPEGANFCLNCGAGLALACSRCGATLPPQARFCFLCGAQLGAAAPMAPEALADRLERLVPKEFAERLLATRGQVGLERRVVTILFSDVKGSTALAEKLDPEDWLEIMDDAFDVLIEPVYRYEGTLARLMGDAVLAFFGAPIAHEDDPERAIRAGLDIIAGAEDYAARLEQQRGLAGFNVRVGIHTGLVVVGEVGPDFRVEYTAMGDAVNLAARMESAAQPGTVLITADTHKLVAPLFDSEALGPIEVKGKAEPVPAYRVLAPKEVPGKPRGIAGLESRLVGREAELAALQAAVERLQAGVGGVVTIVGEAGIGKSRLVAEVRSGATHGRADSVRRLECALHLEYLTWVEGRCLSYGMSIAYLLWLDVLRGLLGVTVEDSPGSVRDALRDRVQTLCPERFDAVYPYLGRLMSLPLEDEVESRLGELDGREVKERTFRAVETLISCATAERPLVLVCEDLHWADNTSVELLEEVLPLTDRVPLLLVCVFRPRREHPSSRLRETIARDYRHRHTDLWLEPLSTAESETLVSNLLWVEDLPEQLKGRILDHAEGNPFYLEEVLRSLIDAGALAQEEASGRWYATRDVADIAIPDTLQGVLLARIDRLQEEARRVLQMASVIGRIFLYRILAEIAQAECDLEGELLTLQREEMIRERARIPELEYIFKHHLTQEAAYNGLLKRERRTYHRRVAEALERLFPDRIEEQVGLLAHHWERAGVNDKAVSYLIQAGDYGRKSYACTEAIAHYDMALELAESTSLPDTILAAIHERRGQTFASIDNLSAARHDLYWVLEWARRRGDRVKEAETLLELISPLLTGHELDQAHACAQEAHAIAAALGDNRLIARSTGALGAALCVRGDLERARDYLQTALAAVQAFEVRDWPTEILQYYLLERYWRGDFGEVLDRVDEFLAVAEATRTPALTYGIHLFGALAWCSLGEYQTALELLAQGHEFAQEAGITNAPAELLNCMGWVHQEIYNLEQSVWLNEECSRVAQELGETESEANALVNLGVDYMWLGDQGRAEECFVRAWALLEKQFGGFRWRWKTRLLAAWGELRLAQDQAKQALDFAERCLELAVQTSARKNLVKGWRLKGQALAALGQLQEAVLWLTKAADMAEEIGNPPLHWKCRFALGEVLQQQGHHAQARELYAQAAKVIEGTQSSLRDPELRETFLAAGPVRAALRAAGCLQE
jgi:class 3 adenylate cyclase/tetratricopeptide (TPR) repeat protein